MKFIKLSPYIFLLAYTIESKNLENEFVGVSNQKFNDLLRKAILGFQEIIANGDEELGYPKMEPYNIDFHWDYADKTKKLECTLQNTTIKGLSDYKLYHVSSNPKKLKLNFVLIFKNLQLEGPYKLDGYLFNEWLPIFGDGQYTINPGSVYLYIDMNLGLQQSNIVVEEVLADIFYRSFPVEAENLMGLPAEFLDGMLYDTIMKFYHPYAQSTVDSVSNQAKQIIEDKISGMTLNELMELIDYFAEKSVTS